MDRTVIMLFVAAGAAAAHPQPPRKDDPRPLLERSEAIEAFCAIIAERLASFGLTERETQIALLVLRGKTQESIAKDIRLETSTVRFHLSNLYEKAGCKSKAGFFEKVYAGIL